MTTTNRTVHLRDDLDLQLAESGPADAPRAALVLHGGGGPQTVAPIVAHLAQTMRVLAPTVPGWNGAPRPAWLTRVGQLGELFADLLAREALRDVLVVGSSIGGWIACEVALHAPRGVVGKIVAIDSTGIDVPEAPMADFFALDPRGIAEHSFHDPARFFVDPATLPPEQIAMRRANMQTLRVFAADDHTLAPRLGALATPALVLWGESDRVVTPAYGRALARAIPAARFELIAKAGHLPQLEQPAATFAAIDAFAAAQAAH